MSEVKSLTSYELVETLVGSAARPERDMELAIPKREAADLRKRAAEAGLLIADEYGLREVVFVLTDGMALWQEDLAEGWKISAERRAIMQQAYGCVLALAREYLHNSGLSGRLLEAEAKRLIETPSVELINRADFAQAREAYMIRRDEYILEFGTVHSHIYARQQELQKTLDRYTASVNQPGVLLEFRDFGASTADYGRGAAVITLNNCDLTMRSRAPLVVSLIVGQLAMCHQDIQVVWALIDNVNGTVRLAPKGGKPLAPVQVRQISDAYKRRTGSELSPAFLEQVVAHRSEVFASDVSSRSEQLARSFKATLNMTATHEKRTLDIAAVQDELESLRASLLPPDAPGSAGKVTTGGGEAYRTSPEAEEDLEIYKPLKDRLAILKEEQRQAQKEYLRNMHARESVVLCRDAYSLSVTRLAPSLKYTGPKRKAAGGLEDACVHHDDSTYMDLHGM